VLAFAALPVVGIWTWNRPNFAIPAAAARPWVEERWRKQTEDQAKVPVNLTEEEFFQGYTQLKADIPAPYERVEPGDPTAPLRLRAIGIGGHQFMRPGDQPNVRFFDAATGQRLETPPRPSVFAGGGGHAPYQVEMHFDSPASVRVNTVCYFDRQTHVALGGPFGPQVQGPGFHAVGSPVYTLRPGAVIAVVEGSVPSEAPIGKLEARKGATLSAGVFKLKVMDAAVGMKSLPPGVQFGVRRPETTLTIMVYPWGNRTGLRFAPVDPEGNKIPTTTSNIERAGVMVKCSVAPERISHLEIRGPGRLFRQIVDLPELPDLPAANDRVSNMLDLRIPRLHLKEGEAALALAIYGQVKLRDAEYSYLNAPVPLASAHATHEDITLGDLCRIAEREAGDGWRLVFDRTEMNLHFVETKQPPLAEWLGQWFQ